MFMVVVIVDVEGMKLRSTKSGEEKEQKRTNSAVSFLNNWLYGCVLQTQLVFRRTT